MRYNTFKASVKLSRINDLIFPSKDLEHVVSGFLQNHTIDIDKLPENLKLIETKDIRLKQILNYFFKNSPKNVIRLMLINTTINNYQNKSQYNTRESLIIKCDTISLGICLDEIREHIKNYVIDSSNLFLAKQNELKNANSNSSLVNLNAGYLDAPKSIILMNHDLSLDIKEFETKVLLFLGTLNIQDYKKTKILDQIFQYASINSEAIYNKAFYHTLLSIDKTFLDNYIVSSIEISDNMISYKDILRNISYKFKFHSLLYDMILVRIANITDDNILINKTLNNTEIIHKLLQSLDDTEFKIAYKAAQILKYLKDSSKSKSVNILKEEVILLLKNISDQLLYEKLTYKNINNDDLNLILDLNFTDITALYYTSSTSISNNLKKLKIIENNLIISESKKTQYINYGISEKMFKRISKISKTDNLRENKSFTDEILYMNLFDVKILLEYAIYNKEMLPYVVNILLKKDIVVSTLIIDYFTNNKLQSIFLIKKNKESINNNKHMISTLIENFSVKDFEEENKNLLKTKFLMKQQSKQQLNNPLNTKNVKNKENQNRSIKISLIELYLDIADFITKPVALLEYIKSIDLTIYEQYKYLLLLYKLFRKNVIHKDQLLKYSDREFENEIFELKKYVIALINPKKEIKSKIYVFEEVDNLFNIYNPDNIESNFSINKLIKESESVILFSKSVNTLTNKNIKIEDKEITNKNHKKNTEVSKNNLQDSKKSINTIGTSSIDDIKKLSFINSLILSPSAKNKTTPMLSTNCKILKKLTEKNLKIYFLLSNKKDLFIKFVLANNIFKFTANIYNKIYRITKNTAIFLKSIEVNDLNKNFNFYVDHNLYEYTTDIESYCFVKEEEANKKDEDNLTSTSDLNFGLKKYNTIFNEMKYSTDITKNLFNNIEYYKISDDLFATFCLSNEIVIKKINEEKILLKSNNQQIIEKFKERI